MVEAEHTNGLVQDCSISSVLAVEILQCCTKPSIHWEWVVMKELHSHSFHLHSCWWHTNGHKGLATHWLMLANGIVCWGVHMGSAYKSGFMTSQWWHSNKTKPMTTGRNFVLQRANLNIMGEVKYITGLSDKCYSPLCGGIHNCVQWHSLRCPGC